MNRLNFSKADVIYLEIGQSTLHALQGTEGLELPLERLPNGRLTSACRQSLTRSLQSFFRRDPWRPHLKALCAIAARGVTLRRITLPKTSNENLQKLLLLQIENEFPLPPEELAWGYLPLDPNQAPGNGGEQHDYLIAAVKKELVEEYHELLVACGLSPSFTIAALARRDQCPKAVGSESLLDFGRHHSELISFENGVPKALRILPWGGEAITRAIEANLGISRAEAEELKIKFAQGALSAGENEPAIRAALDATLDALAGAIDGQSLGEKLYLTGQSLRLKDLAPGLNRRLGPNLRCEAIEPAAAAGHSAAIQGLRTPLAQGNGRLPLVLQGKPANGSVGAARPAPWKWLALAAGLIFGLVAVPYLEALVLKPYLSHKLAALKADRRNLALIDAEWGFFQHLKQNAPPYLDALFLLAKAAPPGARIDSLSMSQRGDLSMRCTMQNSQQVTDFRSKLMDSGFFASLSVEEQAPSPDRQKLAVRISAQWKPLSARQTLAYGPTAEEIEQAKTRKREPQMGAPPMMPMMGGPGMPAPMPPTGPPPGLPQRVRPARANPATAPSGSRGPPPVPLPNP